MHGMMIYTRILHVYICMYMHGNYSATGVYTIDKGRWLCIAGSYTETQRERVAVAVGRAVLRIPSLARTRVPKAVSKGTGL